MQIKEALSAYRATHPFINLRLFLFLYSPASAILLSCFGNSCRRDFVCKGTASGRSPSTTMLTVSESSRQPSANRRLTAVTASLQGIAGQACFCSYIRRLGIPLHSVHCLLALSSFSHCQSCIKINPRREAERASRMGK